MFHGPDDVVSWQRLVLHVVRSVQVRNSASYTRSRVGNSREPRDGEANWSLQPLGQPAAICFSPEHDYESCTVTTLTYSAFLNVSFPRYKSKLKNWKQKWNLNVYRGNRRPTRLCEGNGHFPIVSRRFAGHYYQVHNCLPFMRRQVRQHTVVIRALMRSSILP